VTGGLHQGAIDGADGGREYLESLIRADFERCHPDQTLDDIKRRARFSEEDRGLLRDWMALAARRAESMGESAQVNFAPKLAAG
jgi:hypothetical protein